eukprot:gene10516-1913_t
MLLEKWGAHCSECLHQYSHTKFARSHVVTRRTRSGALAEKLLTQRIWIGLFRAPAAKHRDSVGDSSISGLAVDLRPSLCDPAAVCDAAEPGPSRRLAAVAGHQCNAAGVERYRRCQSWRCARQPVFDGAHCLPDALLSHLFPQRCHLMLQAVPSALLLLSVLPRLVTGQCVDNGVLEACEQCDPTLSGPLNCSPTCIIIGPAPVVCPPIRVSHLTALPVGLNVVDPDCGGTIQFTGGTAGRCEAAACEGNPVLGKAVGLPACCVGNVWTDCNLACPAVPTYNPAVPAAPPVCLPLCVAVDNQPLAIPNVNCDGDPTTVDPTLVAPAVIEQGDQCVLACNAPAVAVCNAVPGPSACQAGNVWNTHPACLPQCFPDISTIANVVVPLAACCDGDPVTQCGGVGAGTCGTGPPVPDQCDYTCQQFFVPGTGPVDCEFTGGGVTAAWTANPFCVAKCAPYAVDYQDPTPGCDGDPFTPNAGVPVADICALQCLPGYRPLPLTQITCDGTTGQFPVPITRPLCQPICSDLTGLPNASPTQACDGDPATPAGQILPDVCGPGDLNCDVGFYYLGPANGIATCTAATPNLWSTDEPSCASCGARALTTSSSSQNIEACGCQLGYYIAGTIGTALDCQECPLGTYKATSPTTVPSDLLADPAPCLTCGDFTSSVQLASTDVSECRCLPGYGYGGLAAGGTTGIVCELCGSGTTGGYTPATQPHVFSCIQCSIAFPFSLAQTAGGTSPEGPALWLALLSLLSAPATQDFLVRLVCDGVYDPYNTGCFDVTCGNMMLDVSQPDVCLPAGQSCTLRFN